MWEGGVVLEVLFIIFGYIILALSFGFVMTKWSYQDSIKTNKNPLPKNVTGKHTKYTQEELDTLETNRRKKLAAEAIATGFWCGLFWIVVLPVFIVLMTAGFIMKGFHHFAIKPADKSFVSEKEFRKARAIVERYEQESISLFDRELNGD